MITLHLDKTINGDLLTEEFAKAGFITDVVVFPNNILELNGIDEKDRLDAEKILNDHVAPKIPQPTVAEKLASVGLSLDDLKAALGV